MIVIHTPASITKTSQCLRAAGAADREGKRGIAMLHINAACVWAMQEMPERAQAIRAQAERYRLTHFARRQ